MKERPILFSGEMVRAIFEGRKTQTRRVVKPQPNQYFTNPQTLILDWPKHYRRKITGPKQFGCIQEANRFMAEDCPYGIPGDRLWVRETFCTDGVDCWYRADNHPELDHGWQPSIHMPRWVSRITLEIINVWVERVQEITSGDALAEGIIPFSGVTNAIQGQGWEPRDEFIELWNSINARRGYSWGDNPWVWVIEFKVGGRQG